MIRFENVTKVYPRSTRPAISDVTVDIDRGEFVFVVGALGSGKSTMLRLALREEAATEGTVLVAGHDLGSMAMRQVPCLRREMGAVFQDFRLLPNKTVHENVAYALQVIGKPGHVIRRPVPETLEMVGLGGKEKRFPTACPAVSSSASRSRGPSSTAPRSCWRRAHQETLDQAISLDIVRLLDRINRTGTTIVMATHDYDIVNDFAPLPSSLQGRHGCARRAGRHLPAPRRRTEPQPALPARRLPTAPEHLDGRLGHPRDDGVRYLSLHHASPSARPTPCILITTASRCRSIKKPNSLEPNCEN